MSKRLQYTVLTLLAIVLTAIAIFGGKWVSDQLTATYQNDQDVAAPVTPVQQAAPRTYDAPASPVEDHYVVDPKEEVQAVVAPKSTTSAPETVAPAPVAPPAAVAEVPVVVEEVQPQSQPPLPENYGDTTCPCEYAAPGDFLNTPIPDDVAGQLPGETDGRQVG